MDGAGQVTRQVGGALVGAAELPADVEQDGRAGALELPGECGGGDDRVHGAILAHRRRQAGFTGEGDRIARTAYRLYGLTYTG